MKRNVMLSILGLLVVLSMTLAACGGGETTEATAGTEAVGTEATGTEAVATPVVVHSDRTGGWVDEIVFTEIDEAEAAVAQLQADQIDIYAYTLRDPNVIRTVQEDPNLAYTGSYGSYDALQFNGYGPTFVDGRLNPFSNPKIREAMNWLINRDYILQEMAGGAGAARFFPLTTAFPDYAKYADLCRSLEAYYAYNPEHAQEVVATEMEAMGATLVDGKWQYNGSPVVLIGVIRTEDERTQIGDYFSNQLETIGFTVDRQYKQRTEASALWNRSDPAEGLWSFYTAGWINNYVARDEGNGFAIYTTRWSSSSTWSIATPAPELDATELRLETNDYSSEAERRELFGQALTLGMQDSLVIFAIDLASPTAYKADLVVGYDLAAGVNGSQIWPYTIRWAGEEGGTVRIAQPGFLVEPWNPIAGTNWVYDGMPQRATQGQGMMFDPYTGLVWPMRIERGEVVAQDGLLIHSTLDWMDLSFAPEIQVPADAWADWDAVNQRFITVGEKYPEGVTSLVKATVYYPADLWDTITWHDGSPITMGDFIMYMIMQFDPGNAESPIYDPDQAPTLEAFMTYFKGVRIVSTDPLVIETYQDRFFGDAELLFNPLLSPNATWYPSYAFGPGAWHNLALGVMAEEAGQLAFSTGKATTNEVEWMSFVAGPSLEILKANLDTAQAGGYIPYANTLGQYVTADEATLRYANLQAFYGSYGHFWIGTGPYFLEAVHPVEQSMTLRRYEAYPDLAERWSGFGNPKIAVAEVEGDAQVVIGQEASYDIYVTYQDAPYPSAEIASVNFMVFNAQNELIGTGAAELVADGQYTVTLGSDITSLLTAGGSRLEVTVISNMVGLPTFAAFEFVAVAP